MSKKSKLGCVLMIIIMDWYNKSKDHSCAALWDIFLLLCEDLDNKLETCLKLFILIFFFIFLRQQL